MIGYIYKTTNLKNGKIYIGQHRSTEFNPKYYGSGTTLKKALKKYGKENFKIEILYEANNLKRLNDAEILFIEDYRTIDSSIGYNIELGGQLHRKIVEDISGPLSITYTNEINKQIDIIKYENQVLCKENKITIHEIILTNFLLYIFDTKQYCGKLHKNYFYINYVTFIQELPIVFHNIYNVRRLLSHVNKKSQEQKLFKTKLIHTNGGTKTYFKFNLLLLTKFGVEI